MTGGEGATPDVDLLLEPVSLDDPVGPDLSYDAGRQTIEQAFAGSADSVDWDRIIAMIEAQARQTRDAWLAVYLMRAGARSGSLAVVEDGARLLAGLFERFWEQVHPAMADYGIEGRKGACESLVRIGEFLAPLRNVPLIAHPRLGSFSGADIQRFVDDGAMATGYAEFRAALAEAPAGELPDVLDRLNGILAAIERADAVLSAEAEKVGHTGTNFRPTYEAIEAIIAAVSAFAVTPAEAASDDAESSDDGPPGTVASASHALGRINNRDDVAKAIEAIIAYYERAEPSSPIPVALERVKNWIKMDFVSILNDIAPGSISEALVVLEGRLNAQKSSSDMM